MIIPAAIKPMIDKFGMASIATSVTIKAAEVQEEVQEVIAVVEWSMTDTALAISMVGGILFAANLIIEIYLKIKANKEKRKKESVNNNKTC